MESVKFKLFKSLEEAVTSHMGRGPPMNLHRIIQAVPLTTLLCDGWHEVCVVWRVVCEMCGVACGVWFVVCGVWRVVCVF